MTIFARIPAWSRVGKDVESANSTGKRAGVGTVFWNSAGNRPVKGMEAGNPAEKGQVKDPMTGSCVGEDMDSWSLTIVRIVVPALAALTAAVTDARTMDDFLERYRALGGMLPAEAGLPAEADPYRSGSVEDREIVPGADADRVARDPLADGTEI